MSAVILYRIDSTRRVRRTTLPMVRAAGFIRSLVPDARMGTHRQQRPDAQPSLPYPQDAEAALPRQRMMKNVAAT